MIDRTINWINEVNKRHDIKPARVLDIGSKDYNGTPKLLFPESEYIGIDMQEGPNVDMVVNAYDLSIFVANWFDAVLCLNVLEHLADIGAVLDEIDVVLADGGYFYVSMPTLGFPRHDYPGDYWRSTEESMREFIMKDYEVLSLELGHSRYGKHPIIDCLGRKL